MVRVPVCGARGFVRFFGKLAELADSGVRIVWFIGNHDIWIFDYLPSELGIEVVDGALVEEIDGHFFYMTHGDGIGDSSHLSKYSASSSEAGGARRLSRRSIRAGPYLFAYGWSRHSRKIEGPSEADARRMMENITVFSRGYLEKHSEINYFIYGHLHLLEDFELTPTCRMVVLGEWIAAMSYGVWDGKELRLETYHCRE